MGNKMESDTFEAIPQLLASKLSSDDDPILWLVVLRTVAEDVTALDVSGGEEDLYANVGACSHWSRPHQSRWKAAGGFAYPQGYGDGEGFIGSFPNLDWSVTLKLDRQRALWIPPVSAPTKGFLSIRVAIPSRSVRHNQAAVHSIWSRGTLDLKQKRTVLYGLRKSPVGWELAARNQRGEGMRKAERKWSETIAKSISSDSTT
jgi:hypothetical protein